MNISERKSIILLFVTVACPLVLIGCDTVMRYTPQEMSELR